MRGERYERRERRSSQSGEKCVCGSGRAWRRRVMSIGGRGIERERTSCIMTVSHVPNQLKSFSSRKSQPPRAFLLADRTTRRGAQHATM